MLFLGSASGHDFLFHLASWMDVCRQWHEGIICPRWAEWANWGFGEPRFIFYPAASWIIGAALGAILPWTAVPAAYVWLTLILAGMCAWLLAKEWLSSTEAAAAAVFFAINPYHLVIVYYRSAFAELLASALFPLLILAAIQVARGISRAPLNLALVFAAVWLANAPAAVIATYSLALLLVVGCVQRRSLRPLAVGGAAMATGFGLVAFYILPAAWEQRWVQIGGAFSAEYSLEHNFIFTHTNAPDFLLFNWKVSGVALSMMLVVWIAAISVARRRREFPLAWWVLFALAGASTLLMFSPSAILWLHLPVLRFVQFPWRWLGPLGLAFAFFVAAAVPVPARKQRICWLAVMTLIALIGVIIARDAPWDRRDVPSLIAAIQSGRGYEGADEYQPIGADRYNLPQAALPAPLVNFPQDDARNSSDRIHIDKWTAQRKNFHVDLHAEATLAIRLFCYPAWTISMDGRTISGECDDDTGQLLLTLPAGDHRVVIRFRRTRDRTAGAVISILFLIGLLIFASLRRRSCKPTGSV